MEEAVLDDLVGFETNRIGAGGFGEVFKGYHKRRRCDVAIKVVKIADDDIGPSQAEISNLKHVQGHPNVICFVESIMNSSHAYIITEFCELSNLDIYCKRENIVFNVKLDLMLQISKGLNFIHTLNLPVIHRDIKPGNIVLTGDQRQLRAKIIDFGLSKICSSDSVWVEDSSFIRFARTPYFFCPEFFAGWRYNQSVDVFSLGLVFLSLITYRPEQHRLLPNIVDFEEPVFVGKVMVQRASNNLTELVLVKDTDEDCPKMKMIKALIKNMVKFCMGERLAIREVVSKIYAVVSERN